MALCMLKILTEKVGIFFLFFYNFYYIIKLVMKYEKENFIYYIGNCSIY